MPDHFPRAIGELLIEEGSLGRNALAPSRSTVGPCLDENDPAVGRAPEAGFERSDEVESDLAQGDAIEAHHWSPPHSPDDTG